MLKDAHETQIIMKSYIEWKFFLKESQSISIKAGIVNERARTRHHTSLELEGERRRWRIPLFPSSKLLSLHARDKPGHHQAKQKPSQI